MRHQDIKIERSKDGIFAYLHRDFLGSEDIVMIWSRVGAKAEPYRGKTDEELQLIVFTAWRSQEDSHLRKKRSVND